MWMRCACGHEKAYPFSVIVKFGIQPPGAVSIWTRICDQCAPDALMYPWGWVLDTGESVSAFAGADKAEESGAVSIQTATVKRRRTGAMAALILALTVSHAQAADLRVPAGMLLCPSLADAMAPTHAGCWFARGGQKVERINSMPTVSQLMIRTTDGSETMVVYGLRDEADQIQRVAR
jgi:hypothetical protein